MFGSRRTLWILFALLLKGLGACVADDPVGLGNDPAGTEPAPEEIGRDDVPVPGAISPAPEILPAQSVPTPGEPSGLDIGGGTPLANRQAGAPSWVGDSEADSGLPIAADSPEPGSSATARGASISSFAMRLRVRTACGRWTGRT